MLTRKSRPKNLISWLKILVLFLVLPTPLRAGYFELSASGSYSTSFYGESSYSWSRRWGASFGYYVGSLSQIQFAMQDIFTRTSISGLQDTAFHDGVYSIDWVQAIFPKTSVLQPFFKIGVGQLNREATGNYSTGQSPPLIYDSLTGVLGAGFRVYLPGPTALRIEGTTYLSNGQLATWRDNMGITAGFSVYF